MNTLLRGVCLVIYALAVAACVVPFPGETGTAIQYAALILLGAHALEVLVAFKSVKLYKGALLISVFLTVLFGFLHWLPLAREEARWFR
ncbi:DUF1145 domain-containing protein [Aromatoleum sp.]|uniref:DUF1145 domain-containing protein n=1 Tax=Aromatoleum sp. TaxID=2307007 RepID=UPI002FC9830C